MAMVSRRQVSFAQALDFPSFNDDAGRAFKGI